ncbi:AMP-binding protein [Shimia biformata]|uniref:AMP-binding protein n=1 Tax=Shimia biformata TaxID=1294299 RepID=UPI00194ECBCA|nr:AMP-binding protein [Shimia biformata]
MTDRTIGTFFETHAARWGQADFLVAPADAGRDYHPDGFRLTYADALAEIRRLAGHFAAAGLGHGHRVAVLLGNRPEMVLVKQALNRIGAGWVPVNPDYRPAETAYLLQDSRPVLILTCAAMQDAMQAGLATSGLDIPLVTLEEIPAALPAALPHVASAPRAGQPVTGESEASLIYTSGTTGRPKGCILSHDYEISLGEWYASVGGLLQLKPRETRIYCPLPLFHVNAGILLTFGVIASGTCQIAAERFRASTWWAEIAQTRANAAHYLGIIIPALMNAPAAPTDRDNGLDWAVGAGVEPTLHRAFETRFGCPLIEVWGMTEMCRILADAHAPRQIDTRAMGRPVPGLEVRVVDEHDKEVPRGTPGEMVLRHSAETPRKWFFSGYLNLPEETEKSWAGGWFHTGDTVVMDDSDMVFFLDRKKNIIRRSGENIAAAEIEAVLQEHEAVERVAVISVPDAMRDEEVMACVQTTGTGSETLARVLFDWCFERLSYYKAPGWVRFVDEVPVTGTQKVQKHSLFADGEDPTCGAFDFRDLKKRG